MTVVNRIRGAVPFESKVCEQYAFDLPAGEERLPEIWVSGQAGWYQIHPAPEYQAIYQDMCNLVLLNYGLQDAYADIYELMGDRRKSMLKSMGHGREIREVFFRVSFEFV